LSDEQRLKLETRISVKDCGSTTGGDIGEGGCVTVQVTVDTSSVALSSARIEHLSCADEQITVRYTTICSATVTGDVDWVGWEWEGWEWPADILWNRDEDSGISLEDALAVSVEFSMVGEHDVVLQACTGGGPWNAEAVCVENTSVVEAIPGLGGAYELGVGGHGVPCESDPSPVFDRWILDFDLEWSVRGTGAPTDQGNSQHSYIDGPPDDEWPLGGITVYAPVDSYLVVALEELNHGVVENGLNFMVSCEVTYGFNHVTNVDERIFELLEAEGDGNWSAGPALGGVQVDPVFFAAGDVLFRALPIRKFASQGFDFRLRNTGHENQFANMDRWRENKDYLHSLCPFEYNVEPLLLQLNARLEGGVCPGTSQEVVGTLKGMWHYPGEEICVSLLGCSQRTGGDIVFTDYYYEETDDVVYIGGLYSIADVELRREHLPNTQWTFRMKPGSPTYRLPEDVTDTHCYEAPNYGYPRDTDEAWGDMFVYAEIVDDMTINVAYGEGSCPSELPAGYTTFYR
jgi:hypothetical protein